MFTPPAWLLPLLLFGVWILWAFAAVAEKRAQEVRAGMLPERRGGVSILPVIPLYPLVFWGVAWVVDCFSYPWGSFSVGGLHIFFAVFMFGTLLRDVRFCYLHDHRI